MLAHTTIKSMYTEEGYDEDGGLSVNMNFQFNDLSMKGQNNRALTEMDGDNSMIYG